MKRLFFVFLLFFVVSAQWNNTSFIGDISVKRLSTVSSVITDVSRYNTYDHAGIPLGILEYEDALLRFDLGYKMLRWKNANNEDSLTYIRNIQIPRIRIGTPKKVYFDLEYSVNPIEVQQLDVDDQLRNVTMPLNYFGLQLNFQVPDGRFKMGIGGKGYIGKESWDRPDNDNVRYFLGTENTGICLGFKLHDAVNLSVYGHAAAWVDSLRTELDDHGDQYPQERFGYMKLPQIDAALDIGMDGFPWLSNFLFSYGKNNFVYTGKLFDDGGDLFTDFTLSENNDGGDVDPIVGDSMALNWKNMWRAPLDTFGFIQPAIMFGFWKCDYGHRQPNGDNYPMAYKGENKGYEYETRNLNFGIGVSFDARNDIVYPWFEYGRSSYKMKITGTKLQQYEDDVPPLKGYNRVGFGVTTNLTRWPMVQNFPKEHSIYFTFGFNYMQENALYGTYRDWPLHYMYPIPSVESWTGITQSINDGELNVEEAHYRPWTIMEKEYRTVQASFGLGASFADDMFGINVNLGILNKKSTTDGFNYEDKGLEFGVSLSYNRLGSRLKKVVEKNIVEPKSEELAQEQEVTPVVPVSPETSTPAQ